MPCLYRASKMCYIVSMWCAHNADLRLRQRQAKNGRQMTRATAHEGDTKPQFGILIECDGVLCDTHREGHRVAFNRAFSVRRSGLVLAMVLMPWHLTSSIMGCCSFKMSCPSSQGISQGRCTWAMANPFPLCMQEICLDCMRFKLSMTYNLLRCRPGSGCCHCRLARLTTAVMKALSVHAQEFGLDCMHFNPHVYHDLLRCGDGSAEGLVTAFFDVVRLTPAPRLHRNLGIAFSSMCL